MLEAIIFDFDGVLIDSEPLHFQACNEVFKTLEFTLDYTEYLQKYIGMADKEMFPKIFTAKQMHKSALEIQELIDLKTCAFAEIINDNINLSGISGIHDFINNAADIINKFAICSGATRKEIDCALTKIENGNLKKYFTTIISSDDVKSGKPSPEGYLKAAEKLNIAPEKCLVIEDTPIGIQAAKAANMFVIGLLTSYSKESLSQADLVVTDFTQLNLTNIYNHFNRIDVV